MNIYESITAIMKDGYYIGKEKRNQQQGFMYRGIDDVMNMFFPLLSKYKVFVVPEVIGREREERANKNGGKLIYSILTIRYTFYAEDGSSISAVVIGEGMDSGDKASNKAMAVGMKYAMFQVFCIPTEEMASADPDGETPPESEPIKKPGRPKKEPESQGTITCEACGKSSLIWDTYNSKKDGHLIRPGEHAELTKGSFGKVLCPECAKKAYAAK